uniref:Poly [ADP-ribose] polymerase n=1 Tax=Craspedostauros australis TaxID=1486917 RepID=A0A7R9ZIB8_9STRA
MWQTYAVKRQTMKLAFEENPQTIIHNKSYEVERKWLFHGTVEHNIRKIQRQGFNRSFAGRNAVAYGKGVYFARDSSYSVDSTYSVPDANGLQHVFMCRVAVGDWCGGTYGQLTPNSKPHNRLELFDSTVDNADNPSVFVVYHDAQAYPEYLVKFRCHPQTD